MSRFSPRRPSAAMVVAGVALVSSFAGPAVADEVAQIAKKVSGKDIKNNSITTKDIRNSTITSKDLKDGRVSAADLAPNAVNGAHVLDGSLSGADIAANGLGGNQVDEKTLAGVDAATVNGKTAADFVPAGRLVTGKAEMSVGDAPKTIASFSGYRLVAECTSQTEGDVTTNTANLRLIKDSEGTSQVQTWWSDDESPEDTDNEFTKGEDMLVVTEDHPNNNWQGFVWEQYGPLNLMDSDAGIYLWGGASAVGLNVGGHDCVAVFRSIVS